MLSASGIGTAKPMFQIMNTFISRGLITLISLLIPTAIGMANVDSIQVSLKTGSPVHVLKVGEEEKLAVVVENKGRSSVPVSIEISGQHPSGIQRSWLGEFNLKAGKKRRVPLKLDLSDPRGIWHLDYSLSSGSKERSSQFSFAWMVPAGPTPGRSEGFLFGISGATVNRTAEEDRLEAIAISLAGAKAARGDFRWVDIQPREGEWQWEKFDRWAKGLADVNVEVQGLLAYSTPWSTTSEDPKKWRQAPPQPKPWAEYVRRTVERYRDYTRYWEVWNEPDMSLHFWTGTPDEYIDLLKLSYPIIKDADPDALVMTGGFATLSPHGQRRYPDIMAYTVLNAADYFDVLAFHQHGFFNDFEKAVGGPLMDVMALMDPPKPLSFNETGFQNRHLGESFQADTFFKKLTYAWSRGASSFYWFNVRAWVNRDKTNPPPRGKARRWGWITHDFYPKAIYVAYNTTVRQLRNMRFAESLPVQEGDFAFRFEGENRHVIAAWHQRPVGARSNLAYRVAPGASVKRIDLMGNEQAVAIHNSIVWLDFGSEPVMFEIANAQEPPKRLDSPISVTGPLEGSRGEMLISSVQLDLPEGELAGRAIRIGWLDENGESLGPKEIVESAETAPIEIVTKLQIPEELALPSGEAWRPLLAYSVEKGPKGTIEIPVTVAAIGAYQWDASKPLFTADTEQDINNRFGAAPSSEHLVWKDAKDLSAQVWIYQIDEERLELRAQVRDDHWMVDETELAQDKTDRIEWLLARRGESRAKRILIAAHPDFDRAATVQTSGSDTLERGDGPNVQIHRNGDIVDYRVSVELAALGWTRRDLESGLTINLLVTDTDDEKDPNESVLSLDRTHRNWGSNARLPLVRFPQR